MAFVRTAANCCLAGIPDVPHLDGRRRQRPVPAARSSGNNNDNSDVLFPAIATNSRQAATTSSSGNGKQQPQQQQPGVPWSLMGRMVREDRIPFTQIQQRALVLAAATSKSGLSAQEFEARLQDLMALLPDLSECVLVMKPDLLATLCLDTTAVASKIIQLRDWFPTGNVSMMVVKRPSLLLDSEFCHIPLAASKLMDLFPGADIGVMVSQQPLLLVEDIEAIIAELTRLMPGVDVGYMLVRNPSVLFSAQRGSRSLGPGAEFM